MSTFAKPEYAVRSLKRALSGVSVPQLRQASIELDEAGRLVRVRFEYDGSPDAVAVDTCQTAGGEVIADFPAPWRIEEDHCSVEKSHSSMPLQHVAYRRADL